MVRQQNVMTPLGTSSSFVERRTFIHLLEDEMQDGSGLRRVRSLGDLREEKKLEENGYTRRQEAHEEDKASSSQAADQEEDAEDKSGDQDEEDEDMVDVGSTTTELPEELDDQRRRLAMDAGTAGCVSFGDSWGCPQGDWQSCMSWAATDGCQVMGRVDQQMYWPSPVTTTEGCSFGGPLTVLGWPVQALPLTAVKMDDDNLSTTCPSELSEANLQQAATSTDSSSSDASPQQGCSSSAGSIDDVDALGEQEGPNKISEEAVNILYMAAQKGVGPEDGAKDLVLTCLSPMPDLEQATVLVRLLWSLGKLDVHCSEVTAAVRHMAKLSTTTVIKQMRLQELSKALWGLARLAPSEGLKPNRHNAERTMALGLIAQLSTRVEALTPQCLSNSLWAIARLGLQGTAAEKFARLLVEAFCKKKDLRGFSSQGLANVLWACAKLSLNSKEAGVGLGKFVCGAVVKEARGRLEEFQPQELSMISWAIAKIYGRGRTSCRIAQMSCQPSDVIGTLTDVARIARLGLPRFTPQGISNIAWALGKMEILSEAEARDFMLAASEWAAPRLADFPPQAIANFLWAVGQLPSGTPDPTGCLPTVAGAAAREAAARVAEFGWQDLAGVAVALSHGRHRIPDAISFVATVVVYTAYYCTEMRAMLNIALSAARLGISGDAYQLLVDAIGGRCSANEWSAEDCRQWAKVQRHCSGPVRDMGDSVYVSCAVPCYGWGIYSSSPDGHVLLPPPGLVATDSFADVAGTDPKCAVEPAQALVSLCADHVVSSSAA